MSVHIQEHGNILCLAEGVTLAADTPTATAYVNASQAEVTECISKLGANGTTVAADQVVIEVLAAEDNAGTNAEVVSYQYVYTVDGAPTIGAGTGKHTKTDLTDANGNPGKAVSYTTDIAKGNIELQVTVPVRQRQLPEGKNWVAIRHTAGANPRNLESYVVVKCDAQYGMDGSDNYTLL